MFSQSVFLPNLVNTSLQGGFCGVIILKSALGVSIKSDSE